MKIEAIHDFFNTQYAQDWSDRFEPNRHRLALFDLILSQIKLLGGLPLNILELGIGPGYLAQHLLTNLPSVQYEGVDFAPPMLQIARERLSDFSHRITLTQADLTNKSWTQRILSKPNVIVSTWALHDLLSKENIAAVYRNAHSCLEIDGLLINGDFIKPEDSSFEYEAGRIKPSEHLSLLRKGKFSETQCLAKFEESIEQPTTSNNYACFIARKKQQI